MAITTYISRYFDLLVDPMFQRDEAGRELFFPSGLGSRGRVILDAAKSESIRSSLRRSYMVYFTLLLVLLLSLPFALEGLPLSTLKSLTGVVQSVWTLILPIMLVVVLQMAFTRHLARGLEISGRKMNLSNQATSVASKYSDSYIRLMIGVSIVLTVLCGLMALSPHTLGLSAGLPRWFGPAIGGGGVTFFAAITALWIKIALVKRRSVV